MDIDAENRDDSNPTFNFDNLGKLVGHRQLESEFYVEQWEFKNSQVYILSGRGKEIESYLRGSYKVSPISFTIIEQNCSNLNKYLLTVKLTESRRLDGLQIDQWQTIAPLSIETIVSVHRGPHIIYGRSGRKTYQYRYRLTISDISNFKGRDRVFYTDYLGKI